MKLLIALLGTSLVAVSAAAQPATPAAGSSQVTVKTFYLKNAPSQQDANEIYTAVRNMMDPHTRSYFVPSENMIFVEGSPDQIAIAEKVLNDTDKPKKTYRLTYTVTDVDAGKKVGSQRFSITAINGQKTTLKQGSRVPVATGSYGHESATQQTQFTYIDVGMNFDATIDEMAKGVRLNTTVDQSGISEEHSGTLPQDPVIRQTTLKGSSFLTPGQPLVLGSIDIPGST